MKKNILVFLVCFLLSGCSYFLYRPDMQQGNVYTKEMVAKVQPGMTPEQVIYIMGSPMLMHSFNSNRWDYVYTFRHGTQKMLEQRVTIYFKDGRVEKISPIQTTRTD